MLDPESPFTPLNSSLWPKTTNRRIPLHPKNTPCNNTNSNIEQSHLKKLTPTCFDPPDCAMDASLAEELNAARKRMERLRMDSYTTERMLRLRDGVFEIRLQELMLRGEFQKQLEVEVDRIYRLKQLQFHSMRLSPIGSLRERELQKRSQQSPLQSDSAEVSC